MTKSKRSTQDQLEKQQSAVSTLRRVPVVLVHGMNDKPSNMFPLKQACTDAGFFAVQFDYSPNDTTLPILEVAEQLKEFINDIVDCGDYEQVHLVGMSMGGVIASAYIQLLGGAKYVRSLTTLGSPLHGTLVAKLGTKPGAIDLRPDSELMRQLENTRPVLNSIRCTTIRTPFDLMIVPSTSGDLPNAVNLTVMTPFHGWLLYDPKVHLHVVQALARASR